MMKSHFPRSFAIIIVLLASWGVAAQTPNASAPPPAAPSEAARLYEEAATYAQKKFADFERERRPYDEKIAEQTKQEQRALAARSAAQLAAGKALAGQDFYYLGQLYSLADKSDEAIAAMRSFLADASAQSSGEFAQGARFIIFGHQLKKEQFDEAEATLAEYSAHEPQNINNRFRMQSTLIGAYRRRKMNDRAAQQARRVLAELRKITPKELPNAMTRDQMLSVTAATLADIHLEANQRDEAKTALEDLRRLGLSLPSAYLYRQATRRLAAMGEAASAAEAVPEGGAAPEIIATEWIDQKPVKLADLRGQVVLLDFWATWCGPCRYTFPKLRELHEKYKDKGLVVLGTTKYWGAVKGPPMSPKEELSYIKRFKKAERLPYGFVINDNDDNDLNYGVTAIPTAVLIDRRGVVRFISVGFSPTDNDTLALMVDKLLKE